MKDHTAILRCLVSGQEKDFKSLFKFDHRIDYVRSRNENHLLSVLRLRTIECVVLFDYGGSGMLQLLSRIRLSFKALPVIIVLQNCDLSVACSYGVHGAQKVIALFEIGQLGQIVRDLVQDFSVKVKLTDFQLSPTFRKPCVNEALTLIEADYTNLMSCEEIAKRLSISHVYLSNEFAKCGLVGPKRILMHFKVEHSQRLLKLSKLSKNEIAQRSGFTSERTMYECTKKVVSNKENAMLQLPSAQK